MTDPVAPILKAIAGSQPNGTPQNQIKLPRTFLPQTQSENIKEALSYRSANRTLYDAALRPDPEDLYKSLWFQGEICCLFADGNAGKSILAVQIADHIANNGHNVLYLDCELSDKQFQLRYTNPITKQTYRFSDRLFRAELDPDGIDPRNYEESVIQSIVHVADQIDARIIIIDNLTYLCTASEKGEIAGQFMKCLRDLRNQNDFSLLVIAHTPKRNLCTPITQNNLAGSKLLYNYFDSCFAIGMSSKGSQYRYIKQLKVRSGEFAYPASGVLTCQLIFQDNFLQFQPIGTDKESSHLIQLTPEQHQNRIQEILQLHADGLSNRAIAKKIGLTHTYINNIITQHKDVIPETDEQ